jgi:HSP20 family protein
MGPSAPGLFALIRIRTCRYVRVGKEARTVKPSVWDEMEMLERRMDDVTRSFLRSRAGLIHPVLPLFVRRPFVPATDVFARGNDIVVRVELPGIDPMTDVTVTIEDGDLVVSGERRQHEEAKEEVYYRMEAAFGTFERRIPIPQGVKEGTVAAAYADGVLEVIVPEAAKAVEPPTTSIPIQTGRSEKTARVPRSHDGQCEQPRTRSAAPSHTTVGAGWIAQLANPDLENTPGYQYNRVDGSCRKARSPVSTCRR